MEVPDPAALSSPVPELQPTWPLLCEIRGSEVLGSEVLRAARAEENGLGLETDCKAALQCYASQEIPNFRFGTVSPSCIAVGVEHNTMSG